MTDRGWGLWRHRDFRKLWLAQSISLLGSQITFVALPLTAVLLLNASPQQMGLMGAMSVVPFLLFGLFVGVWVDRLPRRPILIVADFGRALLLVTIPVAAWMGWLSMGQLYVVGFCTGVLTAFFDVAHTSYLPSLVSREELIEGNSKLSLSHSLASILGLSLAGTLVGWLSAPVVIALDAASFVISALFLFAIRKPVQDRKVVSEKRNMWQEIGEGARVLFKNGMLRSVAFSSGLFNFFVNVLFAVFVLYATRELMMPPDMLSLVYALGSVGSLLGVLDAGRVSKRLGTGPTITRMLLLCGTALLLIPFAQGSLWVVVPLLAIALMLYGFGLPIYQINQSSLRQVIVPQGLQGRVSATMRMLIFGAIPLGQLSGGLLGQHFGLRFALITGAVGAVVAALTLLLSPIRTLREPPPSPIEPQQKQTG